MNYPIFHSVVNQIESELTEMGVNITTFKTWDEFSINASGLEFEIALNESSAYLSSIVINLDWDKFREILMARQIPGMSKHPLLSETIPSLTNIKPLLDIEVSWHLNHKLVQSLINTTNANYRLDLASDWMDNINKNISDLLSDVHVMTRWHVELEGDHHGRYLSVMSLISYFQDDFSDVNDLNDLHTHVKNQIKHILKLTSKIIFFTKNSFPLSA